MKCPACFNLMTSLPVGSVTVDVCRGGCGGIWLDAFELTKVEEVGEPSTEALLHIERDPALQVDLARKRDCPRCAGVKLKRRYFSPKRAVEIDECPGCGGVWLDAGELEKIQLELDEARLTEDVQARQPQLTMSVIRYLYRARLGSEGK